MENHFFKKIEFNEDFRCYKAGEIIEFKPGINLVVGDQGCGKSSLFDAIIKNFGILTADYDPNSSYVFLDTESMNPRLDESYKAHRNFSNWREEDKAKAEAAIDRFALGFNQQSHGQVMLPLLLAKKDKRKTFFIDEPEAGLSIRSQYKVLNHYKELAKNNQLIIATHSSIFIQEIGEVLSLENGRKWMSASEFIELQKNI